eukprot:gene23048-biopygen19297
MAAKARGVAHQVWRATNGLKRKHVVQIMQAMAHPFLDYAQPALTNPSSLTHNTMNKAYKLTARLAARTKKIKKECDVAHNSGAIRSGDTGSNSGGNSVWVLPPTAPCLKKNKWTNWVKRLECMRANFVFRTWTAGRPATHIKKLHAWHGSGQIHPHLSTQWRAAHRGAALLAGRTRGARTLWKKWTPCGKSGHPVENVGNPVEKSQTLWKKLPI